MSERYVTLINGDAVNAPLMKNLHRSSGIRLTGLVFAFNAAAAMISNTAQPLQSALYLGSSLLAYGVSEIIIRKLDGGRLISCFKNSARKCIDTKPDRTTKTTSPSDFYGSRKYLMATTGLIAFGVSLPVIAAAVQGQSYFMGLAKEYFELFTNFEQARPMTIASLVLFPRAVQNAYYHYKVVKGDYAIVDTPPPEPKTSKVETLAFNPA